MADTEEGDTAKTEDVFKEALQVSSLAHYARIQAHEADLKARHAMALAERAMCEAASVKQVAESLTHTARAVAKMALEISLGPNGSHRLFPDHPLYNFQAELDRQDSETERQTKYSAEFQEDVEDRLLDSTGQKVRYYKPRTSSSYGVIVANTAIQPLGTVGPGKGTQTLGTTASTPIKYTESFPAQRSNSKETLPREIDSSHSLPTVWEDSYQGPREFKRVPYTEKKSMRKIQRKLQNIEDEEGEDDSEGRAGGSSFSDNRRGSISKEKLLQSVRFSETFNTDGGKK